MAEMTMELESGAEETDVDVLNTSVGIICVNAGNGGSEDEMDDLRKKLSDLAGIVEVALGIEPGKRMLTAPDVCELRGQEGREIQVLQWEESVHKKAVTGMIRAGCEQRALLRTDEGDGVEGFLTTGSPPGMAIAWRVRMGGIVHVVVAYRLPDIPADAIDFSTIRGAVAPSAPQWEGAFEARGQLERHQLVRVVLRKGWSQGLPRTEEARTTALQQQADSVAAGLGGGWERFRQPVLLGAQNRADREREARADGETAAGERGGRHTYRSDGSGSRGDGGVDGDAAARQTTGTSGARQRAACTGAGARNAL